MSVTTIGAVGRERLANFLGVNLRRDGLSLADEDVLRAINADLHRQPGVVHPRQGRVLLATTGSGTLVDALARCGSTRYQASGGAVYRNSTSILTGLSTNPVLTTIVPFRPLNDTTTWNFIANSSLMRKDDLTNVRIWGIVAPAAAPTVAAGAAGSLTGNYSAVYTYVRVVGSSVAHESNPCPVSNIVALSAQTLDIPVVASADPQVTHIRIYRTVAGGTSYFFDQQVANTTTTRNSSQADNALGTEVEQDNDPPPLAAYAVEFQGHMFLVKDPGNPHYLWYSKRFRPESWPPEQFLELGNANDPLQSLYAISGILGVFSRESKYRVLGNAVSGFVAIEALSTRGIPAPHAATITSRGVCFAARDGLFLTNFVEQDLEISQAIQALFYGQTVNDLPPIDWALPNYLTLAEHKRRLYFSYAATDQGVYQAVYSLDTGRWYHYQGHPVFRLLAEEATDLLTMGDTTGRLWALESGTSDAGAAIALAVALPERAMGDAGQEKRFAWLSADVRGNWAIDVAIDGVPLATYTFTGTRTRHLVPLAPGAIGKTWSATLRQTGADQEAACYSLDVLTEDPKQGQVWVRVGTDQYAQILPGIQDDYSRQHQYTWITLDAERIAGGTWTVEVYLDDVLIEALAFSGQTQRQTRRLPSPVNGYAWRVIVEHSSAEPPPVYGVLLEEDSPQTGQVWVQDAAQPGVYAQRLPGLAVPTDTRQRYEWIKFDAATGAGSWSLDVYIDEVLRYTATFAGQRNRQLQRLPDRLLGFVWRVVARYTGGEQPPVYGVQILSTPVRPV